MGLLYHRPIHYMVLQSFKICVNAFIFDVVKTVGRIMLFSILRTVWILVFMCSRPPHSYTYSHSPLRLTPNSTLLLLHYNENINSSVHTVLRIENITILPTVFTTSKIKAFTQILKGC
jgi:hypothetical protein